MVPFERLVSETATVAGSEFVTFRSMTVKLATVVSVELRYNIRLSWLRISDCWIVGGGEIRKLGTKRSRTITMIKNTKAHIGTGRRQKLGRFSSIGPGSDMIAG